MVVSDYTYYHTMRCNYLNCLLHGWLVRRLCLWVLLQEVGAFLGVYTWYLLVH